MKLTEQEFERIVAEVIRRLKLLDTSALAGIAKRELVLTERVVTVRTLDGKLAGISQVVVGSQAVVTPAVIDELNKRQIELVRR